MKLANKTTEELLSLRKKLCADPANKGSEGSIFLYNSKTRKKLDKIDREIQSQIRERRIARGEVVKDDGYSGRQCNRR